MKTKDILLVHFCKFVRAIFVQFGGISFCYVLFIHLFLEETLFYSLFLKPVIIKHVE